MSKVLKTAAIVVGAVALVATGVGAAIGATGVIAGLGVTGAALTSAGAVLGSVAAGLSLGAGLTAKRPTGEATGSQTEFRADPTAGIPLVIGVPHPWGSVLWRSG